MPHTTYACSLLDWISAVSSLHSVCSFQLTWGSEEEPSSNQQRLVIAWLSARIHKKTITNIIEASMYLNLVALSALALAEVNSALMVHSLVGMTFVTMVIIIAYHFSI